MREKLDEEKKADFVRERILRKEIYRNKKYYDAIRMSIIREGYNRGMMG
ncbi:MAG: hypothetical protein WBC40_03630 [Halobacteriota archaeon]